MKELSFPSPAGKDNANLQSLRNRLINTLLISGTVIGIPLYLVALVPALAKGLFVSIAIYTLALIWLLVITIFHRTPYLIRAGSILVILFTLGVLNLNMNGFNVDAGLFILTFVVLASLLFGLRGGLAALLIGLSAVAMMGFLIINGNIDLSMSLPQDNSILWVIGGVIFLLMGTILSVSVSTVMRGLNNSLEKAQLLTLEATRESEALTQASKDVERRLVAIRTAAEISRIISGVLEPRKLMQQVVDLLKERFSLYYVGVFIVEERQRFAVLNAGSGEAGSKMIQENHQLAIGETSMIGWTILHRQARIALDVGRDAVRFANPYLPFTRSELSLPLSAGERVLGALTVQSEKEAAFDQDDILVLQGIADTLSIALDNARLFDELEKNLSEIRKLHAQYLLTAWSTKSRGEGEIQYAYEPVIPPQGEGSSLEVPLSLREQIIGELTLEGNEEWTPEDRNLIEAIATQATLALENARLLEESQHVALRERLTAEITGRIWSSSNMDTILQTAIKELGRALRADEGSIELDTTG